MADSEKPHPLLQKPLFIYSLPPELLDSLTLKGDFHPSEDSINVVPDETVHEISTTGKTGCATCDITDFSSVLQQREHVRSDLHKFNLKRKVSGQKVVTAEEFDRMLDDLNESISGSDSQSTVSSESDDPLSQLLVKHSLESAPAASEKINKPRTPLIWFTSHVLPQPTSLGVYRAMFDSEALQIDPIALLRRQQLPSSSTQPPKRTIALIMIGGGHFAAIIASLVPKAMKNHQSQEERQVDVLMSKTFHRYTTRRKQGGAQSASDAAKGNAHSAGSSLRRYNEAALQKEVRELLMSWKNELGQCELIFIRATGSANRRTLFGYEGTALKSTDRRIRGFPFTTRRPTKKELLRCYNELTRVKVSRIDEVALATKVKQTPTVTAAAQKPQATEEEKEEQRLVAHSSALTTIIQRKRIPALTAYLKEHNLSADFELHPESSHSHAPTLLHFAASSCLPSMVTALLSLGANPENTNAAGKTANEVAGDRSTRDRFRLARHDLGESAWNWDAAKVGKPLTQQEATLRDQREQAEAADTRAKKQAESKRIADEALKPSPSGPTGARKGGVGVVLPERAAYGRGLTEEMRMKIERERRARAAEARLGLAKQNK